MVHFFFITIIHKIYIAYLVAAVGSVFLYIADPVIRILTSKKLHRSWEFKISDFILEICLPEDKLRGMPQLAVLMMNT